MTTFLPASSERVMVLPLVACAVNSGRAVPTLILMKTASSGSMEGAPGFDHGVQIELITEVQKLLSQPAELSLDRDGDGECQIQHGGSGMLRHVGEAEHVLDVDFQMVEEGAQFGDELRPLRRGHEHVIGQGRG